MLNTTKVISQNLPQSSNLGNPREKKHFKVIEKTYHNNTNSDYTDKLWDLAKSFDYTSNSNHYWTNPELSLLYGTPLYEVASPSQRLALNHLYWVGNYNYIAVSEASTSIYNLVTAGVFENLGGYEKLCRELKFETEQESYHIRSFQKVGYKTKMALVGKTTLGNPLSSKSYLGHFPGWLRQLVPKSLAEVMVSSKYSSTFSGYQDYVLSFIAKTMLQDKQYYSEYLKQLEQKNQPMAAASEGIAGQV
ncbi:MAG: hypothetical protein ACRC8K_13685, partial [Waterburya sp.]